MKKEFIFTGGELVHAVGCYLVSVGLLEDGEVVTGWIYGLNKGDRFKFETKDDVDLLKVEKGSQLTKLVKLAENHKPELAENHKPNRMIQTGEKEEG